MHLTRLPLVLITCLTFFGVMGCRTTDVSSAIPIPIPQGLTVQDVKLAIALASGPNYRPRELKPGEEMTDNALRALFGESYEKIHNPERWFLEDVRLKSVVLGYRQEEYYVRVEYLIEADRISPRVDGSRNLNQKGNKIHKAVFEWMDDIEIRIRQSMGYVAAMKAGVEIPAFTPTPRSQSAPSPARARF